MNNYVVIDLEMCKTYKSIANSKMNYKQELIQIGAVSLDENYDVIDSFATYVSPEFGTIDSYIKQLTGISKEDTKNAPSSKDALAGLVELDAGDECDEQVIEERLVEQLRIAASRIMSVSGPYYLIDTEDQKFKMVD